MVHGASGSPDRLLYSRLTTAAPIAPSPSTCTLPEAATGSLSGPGDADVHPKGTYFYTGGGLLKGCLRGPSGTDFDVYSSGGTPGARPRAQGITPGSSEDVSYSAGAGYYLWRVQSYAGSGTYSFAMQRP